MTGARQWGRLLCTLCSVIGLTTTTQATTFSIKPVLLNPTCTAGSHLGQTCVQDSDCDSYSDSGDGVCEGVAITFTCTGGAHHGEGCSSSADCDSSPDAGDGVCGPDPLHPIRHVTTCQGGPNDGALCDEHADCESTPGAWDFFCLGDYEIRLSSGDVVVTEIYASDWSPNNDDRERSRLWNFSINMNVFYGSGPCKGGVHPVGWDRPAFCGFAACTSNVDCPVEWPICDALSFCCVGPNHQPEQGFFIDSSRPDYIYHGSPEIRWEDYLHYYAGSFNMQPDTYPLYVPPPKYLATLAIEVESDACGVLTIPLLLRDFHSAMYGPEFEILSPFVGENLVIEANVETWVTCVAAEPVNCAIDARQPHGPDGSPAAGWDSLRLQCSQNDDLSALREIEFGVRRVPRTLFPPFWIDHIEIDNVAKVVTVVFTRFIDLERWTCVKYRPSGQEFCIGYLPGDVDNDGIDTLDDVTALIDHLIDPDQYPLEEYQCDIDRSGWCTPADLLRVIDVLNGGDPYDRWLDADGLQPCPSLPPAKGVPGRPLRGMGH